MISKELVEKEYPKIYSSLEKYKVNINDQDNIYFVEMYKKQPYDYDAINIIIAKSSNRIRIIEDTKIIKLDSLNFTNFDEIPSAVAGTSIRMWKELDEYNYDFIKLILALNIALDKINKEYGENL